ncbi:hypothetical protein [Mycoplasmopsis verecunda]|uniref:DUF4064 domain-containing protein n=1 Tax=Mycoplasmopsis verecunda TaxID=171291 RepID=A0A1T4LCU7_9BACT|nr:hypothetical protein [Mycoplasmopsis verecunda]WPB54315.1 hypothetical protein SAM46_02385 [Mycoplasmopsis verecunda]SJZ52622.1 hypothetical protein SAMN02745154_00410 [Mycoplasmopsis verecunda]
MNEAYKKCDRAMKTQIAMTVMSILIIICAIAYYVTTFVQISALDTNNPNLDTESFTWSLIIMGAIFGVIGLITFPIAIVNLVFTIQAATVSEQNSEYSSAVTIIWVGFALSFIVGFIGNIVAIVGLIKAKKAVSNTYTEW